MNKEVGPIQVDASLNDTCADEHVKTVNLTRGPRKTALSQGPHLLFLERLVPVVVLGSAAAAHEVEFEVAGKPACRSPETPRPPQKNDVPKSR